LGAENPVSELHKVNDSGNGFFASPLPRVIAHRGFSGLFPENTLLAFQAAHDAGAPYIECDVHMTRDGVVVVHHDDDLRRTCGRPEKISEIDYAALTYADAGFNFSQGEGNYPFRGRHLHVPTLAEALAAVSDCRFIVEIKQTSPSLVPAMLEVLEQSGMSRRVLVASEHQVPLSELRRIRPLIPTSFSAEEVAQFFAAIGTGDEAYRPPAQALQIPPVYRSQRLATVESVAFAHRLGIEVHVWTVDEQDEMKALLAIGVDGIITNFPDRLLALCRSSEGIRQASAAGPGASSAGQHPRQPGRQKGPA
jgi:glycerophosphoryl diester phosphodiesterase